MRKAATKKIKVLVAACAAASDAAQER